ncbi:putative Bud site selection protein BUD4 [Venustampulla echinocandica]|uniref:Putative Bud site selection protein BUD4 n=1 Tax=Venustampulla echinocandica TaxID=2656787 RepID=A0A370TRG8_9HELO|nr:putative Bud site selection protein BUD4 [Venustampulla echinocandica]RDL38119.1 putative Bud site selection protein BUD4 [Venustampulla echinocandica]
MASPSQPVPPLRIQKGPSLSPTKLPRPLSELAPTETRRNSPSFNQTTKKMMLNGDSSPFQSSPFNASEGNSSPRLFWQGRDPATPNRFKSENEIFGARDTSPSPTRRSSIERLQRASRVKNSNMFAREQKQEYDPTSVPFIERPLAKQIQGNAYGGSGLEGLRSAERGQPFGHSRADSKTTVPLYSPTRTPLKAGANSLRSPSKDQASPTKSSLSTRRFDGKSSFDSENGPHSEENSGDERSLPPGRILHRHAKSVTFDAAPPQVNEYEMATPDLSSIGTGSRENSYDSAEDEDDDGYNYGDSFQQDDSFDASLEDTDKTPVVGPDDWRHASPTTHNSGIMSGSFDDPFDGPEGSPMPDARPSSSLGRTAATRNDSLNSNGDHRPLPPLPGMNRPARSGSTSSVGLSAAAERAIMRNLPSPPPPASISKSDLQGINGGKMSLEERLQLMMIQDDDKPKTAAEQQRERRMRRAGARDRNSQTPEPEQSITIHEDEDTIDDLPDLGSYQLPPRISRESIMRKVNGQDFGRESDYNFSSPMPSSSPERPTPIDPDTPIPTTEESILESEAADESVIIKPELEEEDPVDVYSIPEMYQPTESRIDAYNNEREVPIQDDTESQYSEPTASNTSPQFHSSSGPDDDGPPTPRAQSPQPKLNHPDPIKEDARNSLPEFSGFLENNKFNLGLESYMAPSPPPKDDRLSEAPSMSQAHEYLQRPETPQGPQMLSSRPEYDGSGWGPEEEDESEVGTPESVIRHPIEREPSPARDSPSIPEQVATIKSSGSKLKTRPSATPADLMAMREMRRHVSGEQPGVPPIPERHRSRPSLGLEEGSGEAIDSDGLERHSSFKKRSLTLDIGGDLGLSLDQDFDRVIEAQKVAFNLSSSHSLCFDIKNGQVSKFDDTTYLTSYANVTPRKQRGYLMRQNTKLVVASSDVDKADDSRGIRSAGNSPVKKERPQSWTVEPWNGQMRKNSLKDKPSPRKRPAPGPVPPMPGQGSNVTGLGILTEDEPFVNPGVEEVGERGRLFVKVIGVKDLDLPLPKNEQTWFSLTLDNGVHCVTTAWLELGRNAPIGQEFELVVPNELEFQLTLNAKLIKPAPKRVAEPAKTHKAQKPSTFSRVFASPKKRKELEMRQKEEEKRITEQNRRDAQAKRASTQPTAWDLLSPLAAEDGSFGRTYVCLKDHEPRCYGRPYVADVACFNEWATEEASNSSSVKSKRGNTTVQRRAPYKVGKLELQLLFVPKPKGATDDDMPKSMNSCIREMKEAELALARNWEGHLSQQGGDCPYWRRRYFKLVGSKLTAYHESTRQPRATINLANASKLIDDRRALTQKETTGKGGKRRKSGFAEEEEGYMFVEEGFRIRFNNGEVIDFYADTSADKEGWMKVLDSCVGKEGDATKSGWCDLVLKREDSLSRRNERGTVRKERHHTRTKSMII